MSELVQPAVKSYWFEKGWKDLRDTIQKAWQLNLIKEGYAKPWRRRTSQLFHEVSGK